MHDEPLIHLPLTQKGTPMQPPTSRSALRLVLIVALFLLLAALAVPALAQEAAPESQPPDPNAGSEISQPPTPELPAATWLTESFDGEAFPPPGWTILDAGATWLRAKASNRSGFPSNVPHSGPGMAMLDFGWVALTADTSLLVTPPLDFSAAGSHRISYWLYHREGVTNGVQVQVSTTSANGPFTNVGPANVAGAPNGWIEHTVDLSAYDGQPTVFVALKNIYASFWLYVDDVSVYAADAAPLCAARPSPADGGAGVDAAAGLSWSPAPAATGYRLYFGTDNPPTNLANGADLGNVLTYDPGPIAAGVPHFWQIVPTNAHGAASGCPVWSFTPWADHTVTTFPYVQTFDEIAPPGLPAGWRVANGATTNGIQWTTAERRSYYSASIANSAPNAMLIPGDPDAPMDDWFFSPGLQLTGGTPYQVDFFYRAQLVDLPASLEILWGASPTVAGMTGGRVWNRPAFLNTAYAQGSTIITPAASGVYYIGWHGYSAEAQSGIYVDDITVAVADTPPACATGPSPANGASSVQTYADLAWTPVANATGYKLYFGTDNPPTNLTSGTDLGSVASYDPPAALAPSTAHYWQIVPTNAYGDATGCPVWSFTTWADPTVASFPYVQNFDGLAAPALPAGWLAADGETKDAQQWGTLNSPFYAHSARNAAQVEFYTGGVDGMHGVIDDWLFSPPLQLTGGTPYQVEFYIAAPELSHAWAHLEVLWGTAPSAAGMTNGQLLSTDPSEESYRSGSAIFTPSTTGVYFIGWHGTKGIAPNGAWRILLDDVVVSVAPPPPLRDRPDAGRRSHQRRCEH